MHPLSTHWTRLLHVDLVERAASAAPGLRRDAPDVPSRLDRVTALVHAAWQRFAARRRARRMRNELALLDDRMLRDMGLHRDELDSVVAELTGEAAPTRIQAVCRSAHVAMEMHR